jgi:hypothetical protein
VDVEEGLMRRNALLVPLPHQGAVDQHVHSLIRKACITLSNDEASLIYMNYIISLLHDMTENRMEYLDAV